MPLATPDLCRIARAALEHIGCIMGFFVALKQLQLRCQPSESQEAI